MPYRVLITWIGIIPQKQLHYGLVVVAFSFLQRCTLKLQTQKLCKVNIYTCMFEIVTVLNMCRYERKALLLKHRLFNLQYNKQLRPEVKSLLHV